MRPRSVAKELSGEGDYGNMRRPSGCIIDGNDHLRQETEEVTSVDDLAELPPWDANRDVAANTQGRSFVFLHYTESLQRKMGSYKDDLPVIRVYTVCDESRKLVVRNAPALGCGDDLMKLFATYKEVEECKPMDTEDREEFTYVYWIKFHLITKLMGCSYSLPYFDAYNHLLPGTYLFHAILRTDMKAKRVQKLETLVANIQKNINKVSGS